MKKSHKRIKLLSFLLMAGLLFSSVTIPVKAFIQKPGTVNETVILRQNPDSKSSQVMELTSGQTVTVNNELTGEDGSTWYQVFVNNGTTFGYVPVNTVTISSGSTTTNEPTGTGNTQTVTITERVGKVTAGSAIRVRSQATTSSEQVASLLPDATFLVLNDVDASDGYVWYEVEFDDNGTYRKGFVRSDLVQVKEETREQQVPSDTPSSPAPSNPAVPESPYSITSKTDAEGVTTWYFVDDATGEEKEVSALLAAREAKAGNGVYKIIVVVLLILLILAAAAAVFFYMRWQDAEDFIAELREKQARAKRQAAPVTRPAPVKQNIAKPAPAVKLPQGMSEITPKPVNKPFSQPAAQPASKPFSQPASQPVNRPLGQPTTQPVGKPAARPTAQEVLPNTSDIVNATKRELQNNPTGAVKSAQSGGWKSRNFLTEDDDLEFDFLDMDDK